jgi:hypothetical protein
MSVVASRERDGLEDWIAVRVGFEAVTRSALLSWWSGERSFERSCLHSVRYLGWAEVWEGLRRLALSSRQCRSEVGEDGAVAGRGRR